MFRPGKGQSPARWLAALPPRSHVLMWHGAVYVKALTRFMPAGVIDRPITSRALARINDGRWPMLLEVAP